MLNSRWIFAGVFFVMVMTAGLSFGQMTPKEILSRADMARGNLEGVKWLVVISSVENNTGQGRSLNILAKGYDFLGIMIEPPKVKNQKIMMVDHNMWYTKPGLKKPVPVSSRQKLIGGAAYGDIAATNYADDYEPTPLPDETINDEPCYVFDLKAISKKSTYDQIKYWISKDRLVGVKSEFYTVSGKLFKTAVFEYANQVVIENKPSSFISRMTIRDALIETNITTLLFNNNQLVRVPDSTFDMNKFSEQ
ncbi:MAG: outer membrane lipoprotein-sorting protein [Deltaproteobacteria bacterium]|nr:outer membrane lipoprotein-sorting protein [Deltaproteobacteria bacterium]